MLSKSQARLFFLTGTVLFSMLFLFLTVDSMRKIPEQTKSMNITEEVKKGKKLFDKNNCMGCHTILGEGAYYAPELTKTYVKRGETWLKVFLKDPQAMYPNARKMVQYDFSDQDISDLIAFFKWISEMDLNGFPPEPDLADKVSAKSKNIVLAKANHAMPEKFQQLCISCHTYNGTGGVVGPTLDGVSQRFDTASLDNWLKDPQSVKPGAKMPQLSLTDQERKEIIEFLLKS